jgi:hypothetical protein
MKIPMEPFGKKHKQKKSSRGLIVQVQNESKVLASMPMSFYDLLQQTNPTSTKTCLSRNIYHEIPLRLNQPLTLSLPKSGLNQSTFIQFEKKPGKLILQHMPQEQNVENRVELLEIAQHLMLRRQNKYYILKVVPDEKAYLKEKKSPNPVSAEAKP